MSNGDNTVARLSLAGILDDTHLSPDGRDRINAITFSEAEIETLTKFVVGLHLGPLVLVDPIVDNGLITGWNFVSQVPPFGFGSL